MTCERNWEARAIDEGRLAAADVSGFERHMRICAGCRDALASLASLRELVLELPAPRVGELEFRRARARLLRDAMSTPRRRSTRPLLAALAFVIATVCLVVFVARTRIVPAEAFAASVAGRLGAVWTQARHAEIERVVLMDGDLMIHVRKQRAGERFLVMLPDGELEVRGTTFEVSVRVEKTASIHVQEGIVVVRVRGESTLLAGESWPREVEQKTSVDVAGVAGALASAPLPPLPLPKVLAPVSPAPNASTKKVTTPESEEERDLIDYERAVSAYREARFEDATELLHAYALAHPSSSFLGDASFLEASSLAQSGRGDAAALLAERHLARFPSSFHREDASILVARHRRDRGDCDGARKILAPWLERAPSDPRIVAALGACASP